MDRICTYVRAHCARKYALVQCAARVFAEMDGCSLAARSDDLNLNICKCHDKTGLSR
jgi:hypothetical protein